MARSAEETLDASRASLGQRASAAEPALFEPGAVVAGRYRLVRLIARGGMGEVYEADDLELATRIAFKTIRAERIGDPGSVARLKQEILAARKVTHGNVVRLFDVGFHVLPDQREVAFFTMELLAGETLEERIRRAGKLSLGDALAIARQLAAALDAAHAAGIVHRDFKSQNVILVADRAIVTDFGLARGDDRTDHGATAEFAGTPAYMAPEQVTRSREIGPAADIYALGVVLFEMVTGEWPFRGETALATAAARVEHPAPSARVHRPDLPASWDHAIARCLRREPAQRFASAADVIAAIEQRDPRRRFLIPIGASLLAIAGAGGLAIRFSSSSAPSCGEPVLPDVYVDAAARPGGTGSRSCPIRTITEALAITAPRKTIHVAAGFYDTAHGERFPLELRGEIALVGAGMDRTTISGVGSADLGASGGTAGAQPLQATLIAGDHERTVRVEDLAISSGLAHVQTDVVGVLCSRGNPATSNTKLARVRAGGGYGTIVIAAGETMPTVSGCNLDVASSRLHDARIGIWQVGCGLGTGDAPTAIAVRDTAFAGFRGDPALWGTAISVWDCARATLIERNKFTDSDIALIAVAHARSTPSRMVIRGNELGGLSRGGMWLALSARAEIRDNYFRDIAGVSADAAGRAAALSFQLEPGEAPDAIVRGNRFHQNDIAIELGGRGPVPAAARLDMGRPDDPGHNELVCNSAPPRSSVASAEITVRVPAEPGARLDLAGNRWDVAPPRVTDTATNGVELLAPPGRELVIDTSGAKAHDVGCSHRVR